MKRPLVWMAIAFGCGASLGPASSRLHTLVLLSLALLIVVAVVVAARSRGAALALAFATVAMGTTSTSIEREAYARTPLYRFLHDPKHAQESAYLRGTLIEDPVTIEEQWILTLDVLSVRVNGHESALSGRARIHVSGRRPRPNLMLGDQIGLWARLKRPRGLSNPGTFDVEAYALRKGIHAFGSCKSPLLIDRERRGGASFMRLMAGVRRWSRAKLAQCVGPGQPGALVRALVIGERMDLAPEVEESFRVAGTYHILAISGAQVALVMGLLFWALKRLRAAPGIVASIVCPAIVLYAVFVGGDIPVTRAALTAVVLVLGFSVDLDADAANLLGLAALAILSVCPSSVGDVGFQLSFGATLALIRFTPAVAPLLMRLPTVLRLPFAASLAAQIGVTPLLVWHFHRLAPAALILNLIAVPLSAVIIVAGFSVLAASAILVLPLAAVGGSIARSAAWLLLHVGSVGSTGSLWDVRVPMPEPIVWMIYGAGMIGLAVTRKPRRALAMIALAVAAMLVGPHFRVTSDGRLHLTVLDVGHGDSLVLRTPQGRIVLIDAGSGASAVTRDMGERVVAPYLWRAGTGRVDALILSHAHSDHWGGIPYLLKTLNVKETWEGPAPEGDDEYRAFERALKTASSARRCICRGMRSQWDDVSVDVLWPPCGRAGPVSRRNDDSLVLRVAFGDSAFLLTGDIEAGAESRIERLPADVIKVPHHGSRSSSGASFVASVAPVVALVSVGYGGWRGHPDEEVLRRYQALGARVYRTDRDGAITVSSDGRRIWIKTHRRRMEETIIVGRAR